MSSKQHTWHLLTCRRVTRYGKDEGEKNGDGTKEKSIFCPSRNNNNCLSGSKYLSFWTNRHDWEG